MKINPKELSIDLMAYNLIGEIEVHCNNMKNGCMWDGTIAELAEHLEECIYPTNKMPKWLKEHLRSLRKSKGKENELGTENESEKFKILVEDKKLKCEDHEYSDIIIEIPQVKIHYPGKRKTIERKTKKKTKKRTRHSQP